jgi:hypothetical protein
LRWIRHPSDYQWHGVSVERIRCDRVLHEALTARADPLHLALVFGLSYCTASKYTLIACDLLAGQPAGGGRGAARRSRPATAQFAGWIWGRQLALTIPDLSELMY